MIRFSTLLIYPRNLKIIRSKNWVLPSILAISLFFTTFILNANTPFPFHCKTLKTEQLLNLKSLKDSTLIVIENNSNHSVWLIHQDEGAGVDAGFDSEILFAKSSALILQKGANHHFQCIESKDGSEQIYPCSELINVCVATKVDVPSELSGSFWAVENSDKDNLVFNLAKRGIEVK